MLLQTQWHTAAHQELWSCLFCLSFAMVAYETQCLCMYATTLLGTRSLALPFQQRSCMRALDAQLTARYLFLEQQTKTTSSGQHVMHIRMHTQTARITQASTSTTYCITVFAANIRRVKFFSCITLALMIWTVFWARIPKR